MTENEEKANLIKKALTIVDKLAEFDTEMAEFTVDEMETFIDLVEQAKKLKKNRLWKLK